MQDYSKIFNLNKSTFLFSGSVRGQFLNEISVDDYKKVVTAHISGFKHKDLTSLTGFMPELKELTIEKNTNLLSLEGIQQWKLEKLALEGCSAITDYAPISNLKSIKEFKSTSVLKGTEVLKYLGAKVKDLGIDPNAADLDKITEMSSLQYLQFLGGECTRETLPTLPKGLRSLVIEAKLNNLKDASFMKNLSPKINLFLSINVKNLKNIPDSLKKHPELS